MMRIILTSVTAVIVPEERRSALSLTQRRSRLRSIFLLILILSGTECGIDSKHDLIPKPWFQQ